VDIKQVLHREITTGLNFDKLPNAVVGRDSSVPHAPKCNPMLDAEETKLALKNSLRYFSYQWHEVLAAEFLRELKVAMLLESRIMDTFICTGSDRSATI